MNSNEYIDEVIPSINIGPTLGFSSEDTAKIVTNAQESGINTAYKYLSTLNPQQACPLPEDVVELKKMYEEEPEYCSLEISRLCNLTTNPSLRTRLHIEFAITQRILKHDANAVDCFDYAISLARDLDDPNVLCEGLAHSVDAQLLIFKNNQREIKALTAPDVITGMFKDKDKRYNELNEEEVRDLISTRRYVAARDTAKNKALAHAVEAYTIAKQLGRDDIKWFSWKLLEVASQTGDLKMLSEFACSLGIEKDMLYSFYKTLQHGASRLKSKFPGN